MRLFIIYTLFFLVACSENQQATTNENTETWARLVYPVEGTEEVYVKETLSRDKNRWYLSQLVSDATFDPPLQIEFKMSGDLVDWKGEYADGKSKFTVENLQLDEMISINTEALRGLMPFTTIMFDSLFGRLQFNIENEKLFTFDIKKSGGSFSTSLYYYVLYEYATLFNGTNDNSFFSTRSIPRELFEDTFYNKVNTTNRQINLKTLISDNQELWESLIIKDYSFKYSIVQTDCSVSSPFPPAVITVKNSEIESVYVVKYGEDLNLSRWPTIGDVFSDMIRFEQEPYYQFTKSFLEHDALPTFDKVYGIPNEYYLDRTISSCDNESVKISDFEIIH